MDCTTVNCAEPARRRHTHAPGPYRSFTILQERKKKLSREFRIFREFAATPARKAIPRTDPESPIARGKEAIYVGRRKMLALRRLPRNCSDTVEAQQAELRA